MATGWLTAKGTCPSVRTTPTTRALKSTPHTTVLFLVSMISIAITPPLYKKLALKRPVHENQNSVNFSANLRLPHYPCLPFENGRRLHPRARTTRYRDPAPRTQTP